LSPQFSAMFHYLLCKCSIIYYVNDGALFKG
jgi:hypothetical protein